MNTIHRWKQRSEQGFGTMGRMVARHPWRWLLGAILLTSLLAAQLVNLRTDASIEGFLDAESPAIINYDKFRKQFGRDEIFMVTIEVDELFDADFIETLRTFHEELENTVPYVDTVDSLINARHTYGRDDELIIEELLEEELPEDPETLARIKNYTYNSPNYRNYLISEDRKLIAIIVKILPFLTEELEDGTVIHTNMADTQIAESDAQIRKVIAKYASDKSFSSEILLSGSPAVGNALGQAVKTDFAVFTVMALVIIAVVLALVFRRLSGVLMPLFVMVLGLVATISTMAMFDTPMQMTTSMLPSFLLAVCVGYSIHLLSIFYHHYDSGADKGEALGEALEHSGLAIFFTSITTAAGLGSFSTSELYPVANLGIYGAVGALLAFVFTTFLLPSLIMIFPLKRKAIKTDQQNNKKQTPLDKIIIWCVHISTTRPKLIAFGGIALFVGTVATAMQLDFTHDSLKWFPEDHPVRIAHSKTEARMGGTLPIEIVIDSGAAGAALEPELLNQFEGSIDEISSWKQGNVYVAKTLSVHDIIKETHRALNSNDETYYVVPDNRDLIRQELFMVEMDASDDLFLLVDPTYQTLRATLFIPWLDAVEYMHFIKDIRAHFDSNYAQQVSVTGLTVILGQTFAEMLYSTGASYALAAGVISLMMIALMGGVRIGLISMLPNLLPITTVLALMKLAGAPLDMFTLLIGSIAIGLTVDDTVHFMHGFRREYARHGDTRQAIHDTLNTSGRAMLVTTIVLSLGFLIYTQSVLSNLFNFGVLTALCIVFALIADFLFAPALMVLLTRKEKNILNS